MDISAQLFDSYTHNFEKFIHPVFLLDYDTIVYRNTEAVRLFLAESDNAQNTSFLQYVNEDNVSLIQNRLENIRKGLQVPAQFMISMKIGKSDSLFVCVSLEIKLGTNQYTHLTLYPAPEKEDFLPDEIAEPATIGANLNFLNTLIDTIPNPIYYKNPDGVYIGCNQAFVDFMGVGKEKLLGKKPADMPPIILANIYHDGDMNLINKRKSEIYEGKARDAQGEIRDVVYYKTVFHDSKGTLGGMVCTMIDITRQKEARKELKESEVRVKLALEASMLGLWDLNLSKHTIYLSPEYHIILGYNPNEYQPKLEEWLSSFYDLNNKKIELLSGPLHTIREKIDEKEYKVKTKDGSFKWVLLKGKIVEQAYSKYEYRITGTIRDISAQKEAEIAVQESEMRFRSVLEASNDAIAILLNDNSLVYWNKKAAVLFGYSQEDLRENGGFSELFLPEDWSKFHFLLNSMQILSKQITIEMNMKSVLAKIIPVLITITPIQIKRELNIVLTIKDLTTEIKALEDKKKLEEQLRHAQKMETIGTLAGGIAHDFNNILTPILGYTQMVMLDLPESSPILEDMQHIYKAALRARDLVKQILTFSRRLETEKVVVFAHLIINEVSGLISATIPSNIKIIKKINAKNDSVFIAPTQLHQVIMNICTNAYQAMKDMGGALSIELDVLNSLSSDEINLSGLGDGEYVRIKIADTGSGIDAAILNRIFEPFFTTKSVGEGTGLGLSVAHGIIKDSNGAILVKSEINRGTEFTVYLPKSQEEIPEIATVKSVFDAREYKAILVDDDPEVLILLKRILSSLGFIVSDFTNSVAAQSYIKEQIQHYDLLVTDQIMPDIQGIELVSLAKKLNPSVKTMMITGYSAALTDESAKKIGVDKFLLKPIIIDNFTQTLQHIFS